MGIRLRADWRLLSLAAGLLLVLATIPAMGSHVPESGETIRLHLGTDGTYFRYSGSPPDQVIGAPDRCVVEIDGPLVTVTGSDRGVGLVDLGLGVKSGGAQGTPCSRVDSTEDLTVALNGGHLAARAELDLELKGDARIQIELYFGDSLMDTFEVRAGSAVVDGVGVDGSTGEPFMATAATDDPDTPEDESIANCKNDSDSGPDSGARDNCRLTLDPAAPFDAVKFVPLSGEMTLEGSGDFGNDPDHDTIFYLSQPWDGELDCGDDVFETDGDVTGRIIRHENTDGSDCVVKLYLLVPDDPEVGEETVTFEVADPASQAAIYEAFITFDQPLNTPLDALLQYDPEPPYGDEPTPSGFKDMLACEEDPFDLSDDPPGSLNDEAIPEGHEGCIVDVVQNWDGTTTWHAIFEGDWRFK